jgi:hypothetical protein
MLSRTTFIPGSLFMEAIQMSADGTSDVEYFFNTRTRMVEKGRQSSWEHLMGPYSTHEEASLALEKAQARTEDWDEDDAKWRGDKE